MNKYALPIVIVVGLAVIIGYSQYNKNTNQNTNETTTTITSTNAVSASPTATSSSVPLLKEEDIVRVFFNLINEKRIPEAISMMTSEMIGDESSKQAWGVHFNKINLIIPKSIQPYMQTEWTDSEQVYKVLLDIKMNPESANAPIPYYGWGNGENIRWVVIEKENNLWKISSINTGP